MQKSTLDALMARAEHKEKERKQDKEFKIGDISLIFSKPSQAKMREYYEAFTESQTSGEIIDICKVIIYECCPSLQDAELLTQLGIVEPYDIVTKLLDIREIDKLGGTLMDWFGLIDSTEVEKQTKKELSVTRCST